MHSIDYVFLNWLDGNTFALEPADRLRDFDLLAIYFQRQQRQIRGDRGAADVENHVELLR